MNMPEKRSQQIIITIDLTRGKSQQITVRDTNGFMGGEISHDELEEIASDPSRGLRWRLSLVEFPGSECWVVQTPGGERVFCAPE